MDISQTHVQSYIMYCDHRIRIKYSNLDEKKKIILFLSTGHGPVLLSPGIHSFPFKLGLPLGLPSTFLGKHGWVQYFCKAALREPNGLTHKNQQVFIVMNPIDLNLEPTILSVSSVFVVYVCICIPTLFSLSYY